MAQKHCIKSKLLVTEVKMSFSSLFLPEQEGAEIQKGVNAVNTFVLFFPTVLIFGQRVFFANFMPILGI